MQLGQLAADSRFARSEAGRQVGERRGQPRPGLEQHQRCRNAAELGNAAAARGGLRRQEAGKQELIGGQAGDGERRQQRRGAGQRRDRVAGVMGGAHQLEARIGDQRRAGVGDQRDRRAIGEPAQQRRPRLRRIVVVVGRQRRGDGVAVEELARHPRILAGDQVGAGQRRERAQRDVAEIADRGGDDMQPRSEPRHVGLVTVEDIVPGRSLLPAGRLARHFAHCGKSSALHPRPSWRVFSTRRRQVGFHYPFHSVNYSPPE